MRDRLLNVFARFNRGELSIESFRDELEELNKKGIWEHLEPMEKRMFYDFFSTYSEAYDPNRPPRSGFIGKCMDIFCQFRGDYRISVQQFKKKALQVEKKIGVNRSDR